ncbi:MAG: hypothetical protein KC503_24835 [Myxococcales bacterium]|nr:hypothetical protein [Myxococcales bacterium]
MSTLGPLERGLMLGAVLSGDDAGERLQHVAGEAAERARTALARLRELPRERRRAAASALTEAVLSPLPDGLERAGTRPPWLSTALARLDGLDAHTRWRLARLLHASARAEDPR